MEIEYKKMRRRIAALEFDLRALEGQMARLVPHHGPGQSETEDAMRDVARVTGIDPETGLLAKIDRKRFYDGGVITGVAFTHPDTTDGIKVDIKPEDGVFVSSKPINPPLRLIMEKAPFGGIYYKLQDRKTLRLIQNGIAADVAAVLSLIPEADRERIYETRRYGMGVGE